jgi:hypothetical protein
MRLNLVRINSMTNGLATMSKSKINADFGHCPSLAAFSPAHQSGPAQTIPILGAMSFALVPGISESRRRPHT